MPPDDFPGSREGLDAIGWYMAMLHELLGHDKAAIVLGQAPGGDTSSCLICIYERDRTEEARQAVIRALAPSEGN